jgi:hypothetical protein
MLLSKAAAAIGLPTKRISDLPQHRHRAVGVITVVEILICCDRSTKKQYDWPTQFAHFQLLATSFNLPRKKSEFGGSWPRFI